MSGKKKEVFDSKITTAQFCLSHFPIDSGRLNHAKDNIFCIYITSVSSASGHVQVYIRSISIIFFDRENIKLILENFQESVMFSSVTSLTFLHCNICH
jgi:hypothetical protein